MAFVLAGQDPGYLEHCQRILGAPFKRTRIQSVEYLEYDEIQAILTTITIARTTRR